LLTNFAALPSIFSDAERFSSVDWRLCPFEPVRAGVGDGHLGPHAGPYVVNATPPGFAYAEPYQVLRSSSSRSSATSSFSGVS
jgi:hypothetical protein